MSESRQAFDATLERLKADITAKKAEHQESEPPPEEPIDKSTPSTRRREKPYWADPNK